MHKYATAYESFVKVNYSVQRFLLFRFILNFSILCYFIMFNLHNSYYVITFVHRLTFKKLFLMKHFYAIKVFNGDYVFITKSEFNHFLDSYADSCCVDNVTVGDITSHFINSK